jgi:hypothetical protein
MAKSLYIDLFEKAHQDFVQEAYLTILLNEEAEVLCSNNTLINLEPFYGQSVYTVFPFLEHLLQIGIPELSINLLEANLNQKNIKYRCIIKSFEKEDSTFFFVILQNVEWHYQELFRIQQERNEAVISKEMAILKK